MNGEQRMRTITYREAVKEAIREALHRDERVFLMGEDVGHYGGCYAVSKGLLDEFGPERIRDTPLCESGFVGAGIGAALGGMRPIVEVMTVNFCLLALDQIVNTAATLLHMSGGQCNVPLVIRMATGAGKQLAAQHAHSFEGWFAHIPGLRVLAPATIEDARGMLWTALEDPDPVLICENNTLYNMEGELAADAGPVEIDTARIRRPGRDLTLVTYGASLYKCLEAAGVLALEGIDCEVIDLRTLRPLDDAVYPRIRGAHPPGADRRRGLAQRQPVGRDRGPHHGAGLLRAGPAGGTVVHRRGAHPLRPTHGTGGPAGRGRHCRQSTEDGEPWVNFACPAWARTWRPASWSSGWWCRDSGCGAATSSPWSRPRRGCSRWRSLRTG